MYDREEDDLGLVGLIAFMVIITIITPLYLLKEWLSKPFQSLNDTWPRTAAGTRPWLGPEGGFNLKRASRQ